MVTDETVLALRRQCPAGLFSDADFAFADLLARLDPAAAAAVIPAALLVSNATSGGDVCLLLDEHAGRPLGGEPSLPPLPALQGWRTALLGSSVVGLPGDATPLVLDGRDRLYLRRYWAYECAIAGAVLARASAVPQAPEPDRLEAALTRLFPPTDAHPDRQREAAAVAARGQLCVISGGPGTGKTSTVLRILHLLRELDGDAAPPRIALAAPTGKAAHRLQASLRAAHDPALAPLEAVTLHRLLGVQPDTVYFRHHRGNPLPVDVLVVDEASMIDTAMMAKLLDALPANARLILLGDRDQLASVQAGAVMGDLCHGVDAGGAWSGHAGLGECVVVLTHSWRFGADSGIGRFAAAVRDQDVPAAMSLLAAGHADLHWHDTGADGAEAAFIQQAVQAWLPCLQLRDGGAGPAEVFARFERFRILCAHRGGRLGVSHVTAALERALMRAGLIDLHATWYAGRPVMITRNNHELGLYNGDVGIVLADPAAGNELRVFFQMHSGQMQAFLPARLPAHESAWAITVHKSQGSEYDEVLLLLPETASALVTRELIYTGVTRARKAVTIAADRQTLAGGIARRVQRRSGLVDKLREDVG